MTSAPLVWHEKSNSNVEYTCTRSLIGSLSNTGIATNKEDDVIKNSLLHYTECDLVTFDKS